ncbi:hypothetical protein E4U43_001016 [Claviceps pusilla]|uniref:Chromosome condensation protein (CrcB) n=1 Tax=Claviceps pusilla TaxID=123648 RepID=A0A9P7SWA0_9HYPO|nr:hypothetical protein E4U43_001016 [Claviceps pusilla]
MAEESPQSTARCDSTSTSSLVQTANGLTSSNNKHCHDGTPVPGLSADHQQSSTVAENYNFPDEYANLNELAVDPLRSWHIDAGRNNEAEAPRPSLPNIPHTHQQTNRKVTVSPTLTQLYTLSYLVFFAILGTLARLGLTALTRYANTPVLFNGIWANFGGSVVMGFLAEDRMLFRNEWGTATYDRILAQARKQDDGEGGPESGPGHTSAHIAAAKKAHLACKKTIPLYIGLATGFCGSLTSFSTFIRDVFLAMSNDLSAPASPATAQGRNGGYSFMAMVAVVITTVSLSLGGLKLGGHCAMATERLMPSFPYSTTRRFIDPLFVLLGWGCWAGTVAMAVSPPHEAWRGQAIFALVFSPLGCLARFYLALYLNGKMATLPLGTIAANVTGTAILGMAWDLAHVQSGGILGCQVLQGIEDGFCGCLTTVSTWVAELNGMRRQSAYLYGCTSVLVSLAVMILIMGGLRWSDGWSAPQC